MHHYLLISDQISSVWLTEFFVHEHMQSTIFTAVRKLFSFSANHFTKCCCAKMENSILEISARPGTIRTNWRGLCPDKRCLSGIYHYPGSSQLCNDYFFFLPSKLIIWLGRMRRNKQGYQSCTGDEEISLEIWKVIVLKVRILYP